MLHLRHFAGRSTLRALLIASVAGVAIGAGVLTGTALAAEPAAPTGQAAAFRSDRLSVEVVGQGPDVILIPGLVSSREVWRAEAERLKGTHRVHLVQLAGFAGEPLVHADGPFIAPAVEELARYIREAGLSRPAVIGHSLGGFSSLMLAQRHPDLVGRVMSVDSLPFFSALFGPTATAESAQPFADQAVGALMAADEAGFRAGQAQGAPGLARDPTTQRLMVDWAVASDRRAMGQAMREIMTTDLRPGLPAMTVPVWALYASDADGGAPAAMADGMWGREYAALPGVKLVRVDGSRHFIMADQPVAFAAQVDAFLAE